MTGSQFFLGAGESQGTEFRSMHNPSGHCLFYVYVKIRDTLRGFHAYIRDSGSNQCLLLGLIPDNFRYSIPLNV
jgi:hypothetical protein